ncbi:MAG: Na+/H+ antiporter NhaC family protein, partial [Ruminococcaceae bacterium]|nr:Na+/H+ antiporter NhaC family protein [Oscillospiraceae bacterium]
MKTRRISRRFGTAILMILTLCMMTVTAFAAGEEAAGPGMYGTFWALIPPVVAIVLALITKQAYASLFLGVVVGGLFVCDFAPVATLDMV